MATKAKKATRKKRTKPSKRARTPTVKRAATLKALSRKGGKGRATAKKRVKELGVAAMNGEPILGVGERIA